MPQQQEMNPEEQITKSTQQQLQTKKMIRSRIRAQIAILNTDYQSIKLQHNRLQSQFLAHGGYKTIRGNDIWDYYIQPLNERRDKLLLRIFAKLQQLKLCEGSIQRQGTIGLVRTVKCRLISRVVDEMIK